MRLLAFASSLLLFLGPWLAACGVAPGSAGGGREGPGSRSPVLTPVESPRPGERRSAEVAGGQSGNEGQIEGTYCLRDDKAFVVARVEDISEDGRNYTVRVEQALTAEAGRLGFSDGEEWTAPWMPFFNPMRPAADDQVLVEYTQGYHGHPHLRFAPLDDGVAELEWRGHQLSVTLAELAAADCAQRANAYEWESEGAGGAGGSGAEDGSLELDPLELQPLELEPLELQPRTLP